MTNRPSLEDVGLPSLEHVGFPTLEHVGFPTLSLVHVMLYLYIIGLLITHKRLAETAGFIHFLTVMHERRNHLS
jgi:hypothetical protein